MILREIYLNKIAKFIDEEEIKVITGVRRCGKTYFLKQIIEKLKLNGIRDENIIYIPFETSIYDNIKTYSDLNEYIFGKCESISGKVYLFFDEIQLFADWEKSINAYRIDLDCDIYITGSNSNLLSGQLATLLSGRYVTLNLFPLSFNEILGYYDGRKDEISIFNEYVRYGGFPRILRFDEDEKEYFLEDIYNAIVLKDIIYKNEVRDADFLDRFIKFMLSNIGQVFSVSSIQKYLKHERIDLSLHTTKTYLNQSMDAFIFYRVPRQDLKNKKILTVNEKYYCVDLGFYNVQNAINKSRGAMLENIVFLELKRRGFKVSVGNINNLEIDFVAQKANKTMYIQVSESILDENTRIREFKSLEKVKDNYPKYVLSLDSWDYSQNGIIHKNIIDFLKEEW